MNQYKSESTSRPIFSSIEQSAKWSPPTQPSHHPSTKYHHHHQPPLHVHSCLVFHRFSKIFYYIFFFLFLYEYYFFYYYSFSFYFHQFRNQCLEFFWAEVTFILNPINIAFILVRNDLVFWQVYASFCRRLCPRNWRTSFSDSNITNLILNNWFHDFCYHLSFDCFFLTFFNLIRCIQCHFSNFFLSSLVVIIFMMSLIIIEIIRHLFVNLV